MATKPAPASQMLRLDGELWAQISREASAHGRKPRQEIELRLRQSLSQDRAGQLSPAKALGLLVELHASDVLSNSETLGDWQHEMTASVPALVAELFGSVQVTTRGDENFGALVARTLAQKVLRAHVRPRDGGTSPEDLRAADAERAVAGEFPSLRDRELLLRIQRALGLSPEVTPAKRKERK